MTTIVLVQFKDFGQIDVADGVAAGDQYEVVSQETFRVEVPHGVAQRAAVFVPNSRDHHLAPENEAYA